MYVCVYACVCVCACVIVFFTCRLCALSFMAIAAVQRMRVEKATLSNPLCLSALPPSALPATSKLKKKQTITIFETDWWQAPSDPELLREANKFMQNLLSKSQGQVMGARVEFKEPSGKCHVTLIDPVSGENVGALLLRVGLSKLEKQHQDQLSLKEHQDAAKQMRAGMWASGDAVDADEKDSRMV